MCFCRLRVVGAVSWDWNPHLRAVHMISFRVLYPVGSLILEYTLCVIAMDEPIVLDKLHVIVHLSLTWFAM